MNMKLATIEKIEEVFQHPNADKLELCKILGYQCVVPIGKYKAGDIIVFIQPDTCLPKDQPWAEEYLQYAPKRIKAIKLRKEWSEGLVVPLDKWGQIMDHIDETDIGLDVAEAIGVVKYDPPLPKDIQATGGLPYQMCKTDEERWENLGDKIPYGERGDASLKIDGQSSTHFYNVEEDKYGVTGRRFEVSADDENRYSVHVPKLKDKIIEYCKKHNVSLAFRGESYGNGIQASKNNIHSSKPHNIAIYSIWNIKERRYEEKGSEHYYVKVCKELGIETVPMIEEDVIITQELIDNYSKELKKLNGFPFEGIVIKHANGSFKIINKHYDANK